MKTLGIYGKYVKFTLSICMLNRYVHENEIASVAQNMKNLIPMMATISILHVGPHVYNDKIVGRDPDV